jgi:hypothetical protein
LTAEKLFELAAMDWSDEGLDQRSEAASISRGCDGFPQRSEAVETVLVAVLDS